eukprot:4438202-Prymnesium_polylepis.1
MIVAQAQRRTSQRAPSELINGSAPWRRARASTSRLSWVRGRNLERYWSVIVIWKRGLESAGSESAVKRRGKIFSGGRPFMNVFMNGS